MPSPKRISDEAVIEAYGRLGSCKAAAAELGVCHQSIHERVVRLGVVNKLNRWKDEDDAILGEQYHVHADAGTLADLASSFGRTKSFIARQAKRLGLTNPKREKPYFSVWKNLTEDDAQKIWDRFQSQTKPMCTFCAANGYDQLGFSRTMKRFFPDEWDGVIESKAPKGSIYRRGRQFEYAVRDDLKGFGYVALRSPGSRSPFDILAVRHGVVLFVQCKIGGVMGVKEWNSLYDLAESVSATPIMAVYMPRRKPKYMMLTARKDGSKSRQPMTEWEAK